MPVCWILTANPHHWKNMNGNSDQSSGKIGYNRFLLLVAGLGGLLYGVDVGIIGGALPYLEATSGLTSNQLSVIVAAVLLGSVISTLFSGALADWFGRKKMMVISGILFVISVPTIALAHGYGPLVVGRLLQGISAGLIGVVVPLYLAECLGASNRGKGTGIFQWLLTLGIMAAAVIAYVVSLKVADIEKLNDASKLFAFKDFAWRSIFWVSLPPGLLFIAGSLLLAESPRWLFRRGRKDAARAALLRSRTGGQAEIELQEMDETLAAEKVKSATQSAESLFSRKYVVPFLLACIILACNQTTGVNSIIPYNATILIQAGLSDAQAHFGYVILTLVNFLVTLIGVALVDRMGRKFLLSLGSAGIIVSLVCAGVVFHRTEKQRLEVKDAVQAMVMTNQSLSLTFDEAAATNLLAHAAVSPFRHFSASTLVVIYSCGAFRATKPPMRSDASAKPIEITRASLVPTNRFAFFMSHPFADFHATTNAPLKIDHAILTPVPSEGVGWLTAICLYCFMALFAVGPGVCVWLALSELMPTRIRSKGMSIALVINQSVSATIAMIFLPTVGQYGCATMFFAFAACTVIYFVTAAFWLPETKGKTLEEIEEHFSGSKKF
jgi:MFS family permease